MERKGFSQRRACQVVGQHRSTQRHRPENVDPEPSFARPKRHLRWGYRRAHAVSPREGHHQRNWKKVQRIWGLRVPPRRHKKRRVGTDHAGRPPGRRLPRPCLGTRLAVRRHHHREDHQDPARHRRVHKGVPLRSCRALDRRGRHRVRPRQPTRHSSAATTDLSSPPMPSGTGAGSPVPAPPPSIPAARGRTPGSSPTVLGCETSSSPSSASTHSSRRRSLSPTGTRSTTPTVHTRPSGCARRSSSQTSGSRTTSYSSHSGWTDQRGAVKRTGAAGAQLRCISSTEVVLPGSFQ
jgi:hypothetical protein